MGSNATDEQSKPLFCENVKIPLQMQQFFDWAQYNFKEKILAVGYAPLLSSTCRLFQMHYNEPQEHSFLKLNNTGAIIVGDNMF